MHGIVYDHGGHVIVESNPGHGAAFRILLPAIAADAGPIASTARAEVSGCDLRIRILLATGYAEKLDDASLRRANVGALLRKPIEPAQLRQVLQEWLRAAS